MVKLNKEVIDARLSAKNIKMLSEYRGVDIKSDFQCLTCDHRWSAIRVMGRGRSGCPKCANNIKQTNEIIDNRIKDRSIMRVGEYVHALAPLMIKCLVDGCGYTWVTTAHMLTSKLSGCPKCYGNVKLTNENVDSRLTGRNILRISDYIHNDQKMQFKCTVCENIWKATPDKILNKKTGCPKCSIGKSERNVMNIIETKIQYNYFEHHVEFKSTSIKYVPDFYLEVEDHKIVIEYQGEQHYKPVCFNGMAKEKAELNFEKQKIRDTNFRKYCKDNGMYLIEVSYKIKEKEIYNFIHSSICEILKQS